MAFEHTTHAHTPGGGPQSNVCEVGSTHTEGVGGGVQASDRNLTQVPKSSATWNVPSMNNVLERHRLRSVGGAEKIALKAAAKATSMM